MAAIEAGNIAITKILINAGVNVIDSEYGGNSFLISAAKNGRVAMTKVLIDAGANVNTI